MALAWEPVADGSRFGPYAAWEAAVEAAMQGDFGTMLVPVMARLVKPEGSGLGLKAAIQATQALADVEFAKHERDLLETELAHAGAGWPHEVRFVAYVRRDRLAALPDFWEVLAIGPGFRAAEDPPPAEAPQNLAALPGKLAPDQPVIAIIDEGIGFLNERFRKGPQETRFLGVWLQAAERIAQGAVGPRADIRLGRVLTGAEIDHLLASGLTEVSAYSQVNRTIYPLTERAATARRVAHGTHVLDLAGGAGWNEPMAATPILAVQLPPASVRETSGRRMEAQLVQGLRWILAEVLRLSDGTKVPPVVLNLSIGSLAGPGDETEFLADWMAYEIARHRRIAKGAEVRIAGAYGNARRSRMAARAEVRVKQPLVLDWRVLPDDGTSSFLELWVDHEQVEGLSLTLLPPPGYGLPELAVDWPKGPAAWRLAGHGPVAAASFGSERGGQALLHLALAPTVDAGGMARAAPGLWRLTLSTAKNEPVRVVARVQRDDTPFGHARSGKQSWLDHPEAWGWSVDRRDYTQPQVQADGAPLCPVSVQGSAVSFAGASCPEIWLVGSVKSGVQKASWLPSDFSAEGAEYLHREGESAGPSLCAPGEAGSLLRGIAAAGLLSGSLVRIAGTSMAAPQVVRRLVEYLRDTPAGDRTIAAERTALCGPNGWSAKADRRLGHGVLAPA